MKDSQDNNKKAQWFVMRDLKRSNAKQPAYKLLEEKQVRVFTPMKWNLTVKRGAIIREKVPLIQDLLFVYDEREHLDQIVSKVPTLQYRWLYNTFREPLIVPNDDMKRFIHVVNISDSPRYYLPEEITPEMYRQKIRIVGGLLNNYEGYLLATRGSKAKRLLVELPKFFFVSVEVKPKYIELL